MENFKYKFSLNHSARLKYYYDGAYDRYNEIKNWLHDNLKSEAYVFRFEAYGEGHFMLYLQESEDVVLFKLRFGV